MNWFKKIFESSNSFFGKIFGQHGEGFLTLLEKLAPIVQTAYPIVQKIALLTPPKTDEAILAAYESMGFTGLFNKGADKNLALRDLAKKAVVAVHPNPVADYLINTAIELAYSKYKESSAKTNG